MWLFKTIEICFCKKTILFSCNILASFPPERVQRKEQILFLLLSLSTIFSLWLECNWVSAEISLMKRCHEIVQKHFLSVSNVCSQMNRKCCKRMVAASAASVSLLVIKPLNWPQNLGSKRSGLLVKYPKIIVPTYFYYWLWSTTSF